MNRSGHPIRLLVDAHVFDGEYQGTRTFIYEIYKRLAQYPGLELYMAASDPQQLKNYFPGTRINFLKYRSRSSIIRLLIELPLLIRKHRIDYAHFQYIVPPVKNCRFIVTTHDVLFLDFPKEFSWFYRVYKRVLYRMGAQSADILTVNSNFSKDSVAKYLLTNTNAIHLTPMGVDERYFGHYDKATAQNTFRAKYGFGQFILCVSRIEPRKNHVLLLSAWLDLQLYRQGIHLVILGNQSIAVPAFDRLLNQLEPGIRQFIYISSSVAEDELLLFYQAAMLFIYPSKAEGFGIPPLEAAATCTPVICSNTSAMKDFDFFGNGHVDPGDYRGFKAAIDKMLTAPPETYQLAAIASLIRRKYGWNATADHLQDLILADSRATGITS